MAEIGLKRPRIVPLVRQRIATGVPKHVRVGLETQLGLGACPFDHPGEPSSSEWRSPLRGEHEGRLEPLLALEPP